jgi:hypothetical protein
LNSNKRANAAVKPKTSEDAVAQWASTGLKCHSKLPPSPLPAQPRPYTSKSPRLLPFFALSITNLPANHSPKSNHDCQAVGPGQQSSSCIRLVLPLRSVIQPIWTSEAMQNPPERNPVTGDRIPHHSRHTKPNPPLAESRLPVTVFRCPNTEIPFILFPPHASSPGFALWSAPLTTSVPKSAQTGYARTRVSSKPLRLLGAHQAVPFHPPRAFVP